MTDLISLELTSSNRGKLKSQLDNEKSEFTDFIKQIVCIVVIGPVSISGNWPCVNNVMYV